MSLPVVLTAEAQAEFDEAADWYEQKAGLGAVFTASVRQVLNRIASTPLLHQVVYQDIRRGCRPPIPVQRLLPSGSGANHGHRSLRQSTGSIRLAGPRLIRMNIQRLGSLLRPFLHVRPTSPASPVRASPESAGRPTAAGGAWHNRPSAPARRRRWPGSPPCRPTAPES